MAKIKLEFETMYDRGDVVVFNKNGVLQVGIVTSYYVEDNCVWYDVAISSNSTYTYCNGGDIGEFDIIAKITDIKTVNHIKERIINGQ